MKYAYDWYERALHYQVEDEDGGYDATMDDPSYMLKSKMAELLLQGGEGLDKNPMKAGAHALKLPLCFLCIFCDVTPGFVQVICTTRRRRRRWER